MPPLTSRREYEAAWISLVDGTCRRDRVPWRQATAACGRPGHHVVVRVQDCPQEAFEGLEIPALLLVLRNQVTGASHAVPELKVTAELAQRGPIDRVARARELPAANPNVVAKRCSSLEGDFFTTKFVLESPK